MRGFCCVKYLFIFYRLVEQHNVHVMTCFITTVFFTLFSSKTKF